MRPLHSPILVLALAFALAFVPTGIAPSSDPDAVGIELTNCDYLESLNTVPSALVDPYVPDDFTLAATANLVVGMAECDAMTDDGRSDRVFFGWADVSVYPPSALRSPHGGLYLYRIEHLTADDLYGDVHAAIGAECRVMDAADVTIGLAASSGTTMDDGASVWDIRVPVAPPPTGNIGETQYREFGPAVGGYAYLDGVLTSPGAPSPAGTFLVDQESPLFSLWGPAWVSRTQAAPGFGIVGTEIGFLPWANAPAPRELC